MFQGKLGNFVVFGYVFPRFGILHSEKSGNPARNRKAQKHSRKKKKNLQLKIASSKKLLRHALFTI
jgi:hypothetical protein